MSLAITRRSRRPSWMTPFGQEGWGDVFFDRLWPEWRRDIGEEWTPRADITEKEGKYTLTAELPGLKKEDISVSYEDGYLTITGKKEHKKEEEGVDYHLKETQYGSFYRSFRLPKRIDEDKVQATFGDGLLTVEMPQKEDDGKKKIKVN